MPVISKKTFLDSVMTGGIPPLYEEIPFMSPARAYELLGGSPGFLFESVKGPAKIARYSFAGVEPCFILRLKDGIVRTTQGMSHLNGKPLSLLKALLKEYHQKPLPGLPPFQGGLTGLLSYDFVQYLEKLPQHASDDLSLPDAHFFMIDLFIAWDHTDHKSWIIACPGVRKVLMRETPDWAAEYDEARARIQRMKEILNSSKTPISNITPNSGNRTRIEIVHDMEKGRYLRMVDRAKEYIAAGDIFQANLSQRVSAFIGDRSAWDLYLILRSVNPSPFAAFIDFGEYQIVSSSPERLVRVLNGYIDTRPIAGTRPRGKDGMEDERMRAELLLNEKERAEHIMLIDLERNDLGRVAEYGSVHVDELMITENYSHVIHIVSNVTGRLATGRDCFHSIKATFPGGTITGVPKVRCMEIIDELEPVRRGPYTGSVGYISFSGNMDLNIIIRTFVVKNRMAYVQAGAGIVADSDAKREYAETMKKAEALIKTLETM